tara:strand:+ start:1900 stop:2793 length:894 start_codon:yes stop_codon:yes gene_type:complete
VKSNDTWLNILFSYAYIGNNKAFTDQAMSLSAEGTINCMIDSGAFTLFNSKQNLKFLTLDNYCDYIEKYGHNVEKYVMLDVIGNHSKSKLNYETMLQRGLDPMFVFTMFDNDYSYLQEAVKRNKHVCVAGGVTTKGDWIKKRYQDVYKQTQGNIHALGFVKYPQMLQLPLHSCDSSTWVQSSQKFGHIVYFDNGLKGLNYKEVLKNKKKLTYKAQSLFESLEITPKMFSDLTNHRGSTSIAVLTNLIAYFEYQKFCKRLGLNLFLAVANRQQLNHIIKTKELLENKLTYEKWKKELS